MNGMLLAAGRGERMEPLSSVIAKPTLEVLGAPLLRSSYAALEAAGCDRIVVNLHRHPRQVVVAARSVAISVLPEFSWEPVLLGGAGGIAAARRRFGSGPVLVANADIWSDADLGPLTHLSMPDEIVLAVVPHPDPRRWNSLRVDGDRRVREIVPAGLAPAQDAYHFIGFQVLGERVVAELTASPADLREVWSALRVTGRLRVAVVRGHWWEAGTPESYRELAIALLANASWQHPSATVDRGAVVDGSAVGAGCLIAPGAHVRASVVTGRARVGPDVVLDRCVVAGEVEVPAAASFAQTLIVPQGNFPLVGDRTLTA